MQNLKDQNSAVVKKGPFYSKVLENREISQDIYLLRLENREIVQNASPGQFVSIKCGDLTLRRPFSVARTYEDNSFDLIYKVIGPGTQFLTELKKGDTADFIGPMGNAFGIEDRNSLLIGCGVGIAPVVYLAQIMEAQGIKHSSVIGSKTRIDMDFGENCHIITEDGSFGLKGMLNDHLENIIKQTRPEKIFICGPNPAMKYVVGLAQRDSIDIEVALERVFACGTGVCMGCVIQVLENGERVQKRVCRDGPVFNGVNILWE